MIIDRVDVALADNAEFVETLTSLVNRAYSTFEAGLWTQDIPRTNPDEMRGWIASDEVVAAVTESRPVAAVRARRPEDASAAWLGALAVEPAASGQGIARRLIDDVEERARASGYLTMSLEILAITGSHPHLDWLRRWYVSRGYRETGRRPLAEFDPGDAAFAAVPMEVADMEKPLLPRARQT